MIEVVEMVNEVRCFDLDFEGDLGRFYKDESIPKEGKFNPNRCPDVMYSQPIEVWKNLASKKQKPDYLKIADGKIAELQAVKRVSVGGIQTSVNDIPKIILVLESPHTNEFGDNKIAPAQGTSGRNIEKYLPYIFSVQQFNGYYVAIVNSIQYQCSLGRNLNRGNNRKEKNDLFNFLFNLHLVNARLYRDSLVNRVRSICNLKTDIIVNCCTQGNRPYQGEKCVVACPKEDNSRLVYLAIKTVPKNGDICRMVRMQHPSRWHSSCSNRCIWFYPQQFNVFVCEKDYSDLHRMVFDDNNKNKQKEFN